MIWRRMTGSDADVVKTLNQLQASVRLWLAAGEGIQLREAARRDRLRLLSVSGVSKGENSAPGADHKLLVRAENGKETQLVVYVVTRPSHCGHGHPLTAGNVRIAARDSRWRCRQCGRERAAGFRGRRKSAA